MLGLKARRAMNRLLAPFDVELQPRRRRRIDDAIRLIFFHVPKCGGTSVLNGLRTIVEDDRDVGSKSVVLDAPAAGRAAATLEMDIPRFNACLLRYALERAGTRFVGGHFHFDRATLAGIDPAWRFVTMLRPPRKQLLSAYYFNRHKKDRSHAATDLPLEDWLETRSGHAAGNVFVRQFVGDLDLAVRLHDPDVDRATVEEATALAIRNLEDFAVVGNLEDIPAFTGRIRQVFGAEFRMERFNSSPAKSYPDVEDLEPRVQARIAELCRPNEIVFRHVVAGVAEAVATPMAAAS